MKDKIIQIQSLVDGEGTSLFGLSINGVLYEYSFRSKTWEKITESPYTAKED